MNIRRRMSIAFSGIPPRRWCTVYNQRKSRRLRTIEFVQEVRRLGTVRPSRPTFTVPFEHSPISDEFFRVLELVIGSDATLRGIDRALKENKSRHDRVLDEMGVDDGRIKRLRRNGGLHWFHEAEIRDKGHEAKSSEWVDAIHDLEKRHQDATRRRTRALEKFYAVAQQAITLGQSDDGNPHYTFPWEFFDDLQKLIDARKSWTDHHETTRQVGQQVVRLHQQLQQIDSEDVNARNEARRNRHKAVKGLQALRNIDNAQKQNVIKREEALLRLVRPFVATEAKLFRESSNESEVSRGGNHRSMDPNIMTEIEDIPSDREDLMQALEAASNVVKSKTSRYNKLAARYYPDFVERNPDSDPQVRLAFDRQFFQDRRQATREIALAQRFVRRIKQRLKNENLRELEDMTSDFGTLSRDRHTGSRSPDVMNYIGKVEEIERPYVQQYVDAVPDKNELGRVSSPPANPVGQFDNEWEARPIEVGDFDTWSRADDPVTTDRIRLWRTRMGRLRETLTQPTGRDAPPPAPPSLLGHYH